VSSQLSDGPLGGPWPAPGEQLGEVRVEHAELVAPGVAHDPEVEAALLLVVVAGRAQRFQALDLGVNIVGLQVEVHAFLGDLLVVGALEQHAELEIHYTPKHGSWLNMAEIELAMLAGQCLDRRLANQPTLEREVAAWQAARNRAGRGVNWRFTTEDARIKLKHLYPTTQG
jgi:hypothetical protein